MGRCRFTLRMVKGCVVFVFISPCPRLWRILFLLSAEEGAVNMENHRTSAEPPGEIGWACHPPIIASCHPQLHPHRGYFTSHRCPTLPLMWWWEGLDMPWKRKKHLFLCLCSLQFNRLFWRNKDVWQPSNSQRDCKLAC